jgi:hypothetical protein
VGSSSLPSSDVEGRLLVRGPDSMVGPYWETSYALIAFEDGILGQGVALVSSSVSLLHLRVISAAKLCCIET